MSDSFDVLRGAICLIRNGEDSGTGYLVQPDMVATCAHVVKGQADGAEISLLLGETNITGNLFKIDADSDAALIKLPTPCSVQPLPLAGACLRKSNFDGYGFPGTAGGAPVPLDGRVMDPNGLDKSRRPSLIVYSDAVGAGVATRLGGFSGSPVAVEGFVVGHLQKIIGDDEDPTKAAYGYIRATPSAVVLKLLGKNPVVDVVGGPYETVPPLPENFVPREEDLGALRTLILNEPARKLALVALVGMPGLGKTMLAQALCEDQAVNDAFPGGIVWIKLGEKPTDAELIVQMGEAMKALGTPSERYDSVAGASNALRTRLRNKAVLLVLDDVWQAGNVALFQPNNPGRCRLLITTRSTDIAAAARARPYSLGLLADRQSLHLLASSAGWETDNLPAAAWDLAKACKGLPLALSIVGGMLWGGPEAGWQDVLDTLNAANLDSIALPSLTYNYPSLTAAFGASIESLGSKARQDYLDLAVFPKGTPAPAEALGMLWNTTPRAARATMTGFIRRSLATSDSAGRLALHDLLWDYVRARSAKDRLALDQRMVESYRQRCSSGWASGPNDGYFFERLTYHLNQAGMQAELNRLLMDFAWMQAKLKVTDVPGLLNDYEQTQPDDGPRRLVRESILFSAPILNADKDLVREVIKRSAQVLTIDRSQLAAQLVGRLQARQEPAIRAFLASARALQGTPWLRPLIGSLVPPGDPFLFSLAGHAGTIRSLAVTPDGRWGVSVGNSHPDGTARIWDFGRGVQLHALADEAERGGYNPVALTPDGRSALIAHGNDVRVWNVLTGERIVVLQGHPTPISALCVAEGGRWAISASDDGLLILWDLLTWCPSARLSLQEVPVEVAISPDGRFAAALSESMVIHWSLEGSREVLRRARSEGHSFWQFFSRAPFVISPDGLRIYFGSPLEVWDVRMGKQWLAFGNVEPGRVMAVTPDGQTALCTRVGEEIEEISVWDVPRRGIEQVLPTHFEPSTTVAITPDGRTAVTSDFEHNLKVWALENKRPSVAKLAYDFSTVVVEARVEITSDGRWAVLIGAGQTLDVWELETGQRVTLPKEREVATAAAPDSTAGMSERPIQSGFYSKLTPDQRMQASLHNRTVSVFLTSAPKSVASYTSDVAMQTLAISDDGQSVAAVDRLWRIHLLQVEGF
jgi:WD40 repeat protein